MEFLYIFGFGTAIALCIVLYVLRNRSIKNTEVATQEVTSALPKCFVVGLRCYASIILFSAFIISVLLMYSLTSKGGKLIPVLFDGSHLALFAVVAFVIAIVLIVFYIMYGIGVYRLQRWAIPLIVISAFGAALTGVLKIFNMHSAQMLLVLFHVGVIVFFVWISYVSVRYRSLFAGSGKKLWIQIPLLVIFILSLAYGVLAQVFPDDRRIVDNDLVLPLESVLTAVRVRGSRDCHMAEPGRTSSPRS